MWRDSGRSKRSARLRLKRPRQQRRLLRLQLQSGDCLSRSSKHSQRSATLCAGSLVLRMLRSASNPHAGDCGDHSPTHHPCLDLAGAAHGPFNRRLRACPSCSARLQSLQLCSTCQRLCRAFRALALPSHRCVRRWHPLPQVAESLQESQVQKRAACQG